MTLESAWRLKNMMPSSLAIRPKPRYGPAVTYAVCPFRVTGPLSTTKFASRGETDAESAVAWRFGPLNRSFRAVWSSIDGPHGFVRLVFWRALRFE